MIRLLLASYSEDERRYLARLLAELQAQVEEQDGCEKYGKQLCINCENRHICTDLLNASIFARDYVEPAK